jgi:CheY-like chemotaxis protein
MEKRTILVVDDTPIFRDPLAASLRLAGYETACAGNGEEALAAVTARRPDLIILDMAMPVMDGVAFLRALRGRGGPDAQIPVVVLSAAPDQRVAFEAGALGARDYLVKSRVSLEEILARVGKVLGGDGRRPAPADSPAGTGTAASPSSTAPSPSTRPPVPAPASKARAGRPAELPPPDPSLVHLMCPRKTCGRIMSVGPELRGTSVACTHCGGALRVPAQRDKQAAAKPASR